MYNSPTSYNFSPLFKQRNIGMGHFLSDYVNWTMSLFQVFEPAGFKMKAKNKKTFLWMIKSIALYILSLVWLFMG